MEAVSLISPEYLAKSNIPVGQIKMLIKAVKQTFLSEDATMAEDALQSGHAQPNQDDATRTSGNTVNNAIHTGDAYVDDQRQHGEPSCTTANSGRSNSFIRENFSWQDPQIYIKSLANTQDNYHDIVDFEVPLAQVLMIHLVVLFVNRTFIFKTGSSKPKLEL